MEENKKPETTSQQDSAPVDYSHYMGTLNRIYRRNNNPKKTIMELSTIGEEYASSQKYSSYNCCIFPCNKVSSPQRNIK